ncbi:MAG: hypothetical protein ACYDH0_12560 [Candidatus Aminicenantales bacterium]
MSRAATGLAAGLLVLSTVLVYFFTSAGNRFLRNTLPLPFGYSYQLRQGSDFLSGKIQSVSPETIKGIWGAAPRGDLLILNSWIYSPRNQSVNAYFSGNGDRELFVRDVASVNAGSIRHVLKLKKGYNRIQIKFIPNRDEIPQLAFQISEEVAFYDYVLPQSRASRSLSRLFSFLDRFKAAPFLLAFLFLLFKMVPAALSASPRPKPSVDHDRRFFSSLFRAGSFFLASAPLAVYLNHAIGLRLPDPGLLTGCAAASLWLLIRDLPREKAGFRLDRTHVVVLALIVLAVFSQIYAASHSFLPPPAQGSDFDNHLRMMRYYEETGEIFPRMGFIIYPQGIHDALVLTANFLGSSLEKTLIVFLVFVLIMLYEALYLLSRDMFGRIPFVHFFLALALSYFPFIYDRLFRWYSFPSILAILFFLLSLHFFLKGDRLVSSVALAGALITYPYYAVAFGIVIVCMFLDQSAVAADPIRRKLKALVSYFALPFFASAVYFFVYWTHGLTQQQEGFDASFKINPFVSMHGINALLFLGGMYYLSKAGNRKTAVLATLGLIAGFLIYDVPYRLFSLISTYYFLKTMQVVILTSILVEMFALSKIFRGWEDKVFLRFILLSGAIGIFLLRIFGFLAL